MKGIKQRILSALASITLILAMTATGLFDTGLMSIGMPVEAATFSSLAEARADANRRCIENFHWTTTSLPKWDGTTTNCWNATTKTFTVNKPSDLAYALSVCSYYTGYTGATIDIKADLDMNGSQYRASSSTWWYLVKFKGNNHTIYNLNVSRNGYCGLTNGGINSTVSDCTFKSLYCYGAAGDEFGIIPIGELSTSYGTYIYRWSTHDTFSNLHFYDSIFGGTAACNHAGACGGLGSIDMRNCSAERCYAVGTWHIGNIYGLYEPAYVYNSYACDGISVDYGGHGGGFMSCSDTVMYAENCWSNTECFGTRDMGCFTSGCMGDRIYDYVKKPDGTSVAHTTCVNCFTSGVVQSDSYAGGFIGAFADYGNGNINYFTNCYSTSQVGLQYNSSYQGGFVGNSGRSYYTNCYAAGEVGSITTNYAGGGYCGGFAGNASIGYLSNCYYDMQTTAMNNRGIGTYGISYFPLSRTADGVWAKYSGGGNRLTGVTTRILTNKKVNLGNAYVATTGLYPQLRTMTNINNDYFKAYSRASVATVFCDDWKDITGTGFDNIRDIIRPLCFSSTQSFSGNNSFVDAYVPEGDILLDWKSDGTLSLVDGESPIVELTKASPYYSLSLYPGIEWVEVNAKYKNVVGKRRLRVIPTSVIEVGDDELLNIYRDGVKSDTYDYKKDFKTTYIEKNVLYNLMNNGVVNRAYLRYAGDITAQTYDDKKISGTVAFPFNATQKTARSEVIFNRSTTNDGMASVEEWYNKMNGDQKFIPDDSDVYNIDFRVYLNDGRFLQNTKDVNIIVPYAVGYYYNYSGRLNGQLIKPTSLFYSQYDLDDFDHGFVFLSYGKNPKRDGYQFIGWTLDPENTIPVDQSYFDNYSKNVGVLSENIKVYANWLSNDFCPKLIIDPNGGTYNGSADKQTIVQLDNTSYEVNGTLRGWDDYHFVGWEFTGGGAWTSTDPVKGHGRYDFGEGPVTGILTAKWAQKLPVTYEDRLGSANGKLLGTTTKWILPGTVVSGADLGTDKTKGKYYPGYTYVSNSGSVVLDGPKTVYRFFELNRWNVIYDKNIDTSNTLYGNSPVEVQYTMPVDTRYTSRDSLSHYSVRTGWDFIGWSQNRDASSGYDDSSNGLAMPDRDLRLYALFSRYLNLVLAPDVVTNRPSYSWKQTIYNRTSEFNFNLDEVKEASKREDGQYVVTFDSGGGVLIDKGATYYSDGGMSASALEGGKITAYPRFSGWYTKPYSIGEYLGSTDGEKVGNSGDTFVITPDIANEFDYVVKGSSVDKGAKYVSNNRTVTLYAQWQRALITLPDAKRDSRDPEVDTDNGSDSDYFVGWFTEPQISEDSEDGGEFVGRPGDVVYIDRTITLYPWFNKAPVLIRSNVVNNITNPEASKDNMFWEGQSISYQQLISLVDGYDKDNHYQSTGADGRIEWNGLALWQDLYLLNVQTYLNTYCKENFPDMSEAQRTAYINEEIAKFNNYVNHYNDDGSDDFDDFEPYIIGIDYYCDGTDPKGRKVSSLTEDKQTDASFGLLTDSDHVGKIVIHYAISDNGVYDYYKHQYITKDNGYEKDSQKVVYYDCITYIAFNNPPEIELTNAYLYSTDTTYSANTIVKTLLLKQKPSDFEDDYDDAPWWYTGGIEGTSNPSESEYDCIYNTRDKLVKSLHVTGVSNIHFQNDYEDKNPDVCQTVKNITDIKDLFALKDSGSNAFTHITNFDVTVDCEDQWGKKASDALNGLSERERTFTVIMFDNVDDDDLKLIKERMRYVDDFEAQFLSELSYWRAEGYGSLFGTFENYKKTHTPVVSEGLINGKYDDKTIKSVPITVNDYSQ